MLDYVAIDNDTTDNLLGPVMDAHVVTYLQTIIRQDQQAVFSVRLEDEL